MVLKEMISSGLCLVREEPHHNLSVAFRCRLMFGLGDAGGPVSSRISRSRRVSLAVLSVEKVLGLWERAFPADRSPHHALRIGTSLGDGIVSETTAEYELDKLWTHCDNLSWRHKDKQIAILCGYGAAQVIREALSDVHFGCDQITEASTDLDVDPYDHDSAFCASSAWAGGAPWRQGSDARRRLEFWTWWLTAALPMAIAAPEPDARLPAAGLGGDLGLARDTRPFKGEGTKGDERV